MKKIKILFALLSGLFITVACNDDYMERYPEREISDGSVWKTPTDLKLYVNNFYNLGEHPRDVLWQGKGTGHIGPFTLDREGGSDTQIPLNYNKRMNGQDPIPANSAEWNYTAWGTLRNINYFFANYEKVTGEQAEIDRYVGEALFFRALFYYKMLVKFGNLPWIEDLPFPGDDILKRPRDSRDFVVDKLMTELDNAVKYLPSRSGGWDGRVNKETAMLLQARIALYEGTWEKYHAGTDFGVQGSDGKKFIEKAKDVTDDLIALGTCDLDNVGVENGYQLVFNQKKHNNSKEVLFWREYNQSLGYGHAWSNYSTYGADSGLTKRLIDMYLCIDGKPIDGNPLYKGDASLIDVVENRDPRLNQTIYVNDEKHLQHPDEMFTYPAFADVGKASVTGYQLYKGHVPSTTLATTTHETAFIYFRYAEALLINAEAKAELGTITQSDIDATINKLRRRLVGMADMKLSDVNTMTASTLLFPGVSNIINEVRRERTVELAAEGFRTDDIFRWAAAGILIKGYVPQGAKLAQWKGNLDPNPNEAFHEAVSGLVADRDGYIAPYAKQTSFPDTGFNFDLDRDYLMPLPSDQLTLNPDLKQNPGWDD